MSFVFQSILFFVYRVKVAQERELNLQVAHYARQTQLVLHQSTEQVLFALYRLNL